MLINRTTRHLSLTDLDTVYYNQVEEAVRAFELADQTIWKVENICVTKLRQQASLSNFGKIQEAAP